MQLWKGSTIKKIIERVKKDDIQLLKPSTSPSDDIYGTNPAFTTYTIQAIVTPSMTRELFYMKTGMIEDGTMRIFVFPYYVISGNTITVETGDRVQMGDLKGEILNIYDYNVPDEGIIMKECIVK